jgi:hypothetical protein
VTYVGSFRACELYLNAFESIIKMLILRLEAKITYGCKNMQDLQIDIYYFNTFAIGGCRARRLAERRI